MYRDSKPVNSDSKPVNSDRISNERNQVLSLKAPYNHLNILNNYPLMMISWHNPLSISTKGGGSGQVSLSRGWHMTAVVLDCKRILNWKVISRCELLLKHLEMTFSSSGGRMAKTCMRAANIMALKLTHYTLKM